MMYFAFWGEVCVVCIQLIQLTVSGWFVYCLSDQTLRHFVQIDAFYGV